MGKVSKKQMFMIHVINCLKSHVLQVQGHLDNKFLSESFVIVHLFLYLKRGFCFKIIFNVETYVNTLIIIFI